MNRKVMKLETPERLRELNPQETLRRIGLGEHDAVCDIGAGTGIFTIPAAKITDNWVFALETDEAMLGVINQKLSNEKLPNVKTVRVAGDRFDMSENAVDLVILVTVLHEIENTDAFLAEIKRIIKSHGKLAVVEFHKRPTPMGAPLTLRISQDEVIKLCDGYGFIRSDEFDLGDNMYCMVLVQEA